MVARPADPAEAEASTGSEGEGKRGEGGKSGKVKPSYKHIPHSQKPPHLVAKRNARERRRVQAVNQAFYKLRKSVPIENRNKRVSKVKTLQRAIDYIRKLERILAEDDDGQQIDGGSAIADSQVAGATLNLSSEQQQPVRSTRSGGRKAASSNCDQHQLQDNNQQPQIMQRQKRARQKTANKLPAIGEQPPSDTNHCQTQTAVDNAELYCTELDLQTKQSYYNTYQQPPDVVLRESSAYNANLYYSSDQYATVTANNGYLAATTQVSEHAATYHHANYYSYPPMANNTLTTTTAATSAEKSASPAYHGPAAPASEQPLALTGANCWLTHQTQVSGSAQQQVTSLNGSTDQSTAPPVVVAAADSSTSSTGSSSSSSFALLQSPSSTNSSSLSTTVDSTQSDNSSAAAVVRQRGSAAAAAAAVGRPTSVGSTGSLLRQRQQQVNSPGYLAYANAAAAVVVADRMEARASHLSFAVNGGSNNDNACANLPYRHNNGNHQRQQQLDERSKVNLDELATMKATGHHQVRHLLDGGNSSATSSSPASSLGPLANNNLHEYHSHQPHHHHDQHNNYNQYHRHHHLPLHQQSSFSNNQHNHHHQLHHSHSNHLSALQSATTNGQSTANNLLLPNHHQTIQEPYTNG